MFFKTSLEDSQSGSRVTEYRNLYTQNIVLAEKYFYRDGIKV